MWKSQGIMFVFFLKIKINSIANLADFSFPFNQGGESHRAEQEVIKYNYYDSLVLEHSMLADWGWSGMGMIWHGGWSGEGNIKHF